MGGDETKNSTTIYFQNIVDTICEWGKNKNIQIIAWEDILNRVEPPDNLIIQKWKIYSHKKIFNIDKKKIINSLGFYLDKSIDPYTMFRTKLENEYLGYIACSWNELTDDNNVLSVIFPSLYLLGEKWFNKNIDTTNSIILLYDLCEKYGWNDTNDQTNWKRRQWKPFVLNKDDNIPIRSTTSTKTTTILNREHDNYPLISNFLITFAYDLHNVLHNNIYPETNKINTYIDGLIDAGGNAELAKQLYDCSIHKSDKFKILKKIKRSMTEEHETYKNGFICVFRELLR
jgi:hypothetical protein